MSEAIVEREKLLAGGLRDIVRAGLSETDTRSLAMECAQINPDKTLTAISADTEGSIFEQPWAVEVFRIAAKEAKTGGNIFDAFGRIKGHGGMGEVLVEAAARFPQETGQRVAVYADLPEGEEILKAAESKDRMAGYYALVELKKRERRELVDSVEWVQKYLVDHVIQNDSATVTVASAQDFGDKPWFAQALEKLPAQIRNKKDYDSVNDILTRGEFPQGVAHKLQDLMQSIEVGNLSSSK